MHAQIITTERQLHEIREEWNDLLSRSVSNVPFLRHEFVTTWWTSLGGGEWESGDLYIIIGRGEGGALKGIAPLFKAKDHQQQIVLRIIGTVEIADYLDFIADPGDLYGFVDLVGQKLMTEEWDLIDLHNIPASSPTVAALEAWASSVGIATSKSTLQPCPAIPISSTWDDYLDGLQKKQRQEVRRKLRNAQRGAGNLKLSVIEHQAELDGAFEKFIHLMKSDPRKHAFLTETMQTQFRLTAQAALRAGWLHLSFLEVDGAAASGLFSFDYGNRLWIYNSGIDLTFRDISPGWVHLAMLIQWAIEHQREALDFLRGDEDYKFRLGGIAQQIVRIKLPRPDIKPI
jgi:CelD/BcsL family acetyltransferase involved in cellulose biosynthesis